MISHFSLGPPDPELQAFIRTRVPNTTSHYYSPNSFYIQSWDPVTYVPPLIT